MTPDPRKTLAAIVAECKALIITPQRWKTTPHGMSMVPDYAHGEFQELAGMVGTLAEMLHDLLHPTVTITVPPPDSDAARRVEDLIRKVGGTPCCFDGPETSGDE